MKLREEMVERAISAPEFGPASPDNPPLTGWTVSSDSFSDVTQAAVDSVMVYPNVLLEMVLRLAEAIDELWDTLDVERDEDG